MAANAKTAITKALPSAQVANSLWKKYILPPGVENRIRRIFIVKSSAFPVWKKYTLPSHGIWDRVRRIFAVDPDRSSGIPLNAQFRNPPPGANPPQLYDDPVTVPAGDIADNAYFKRDVRRNYPRLSTVSQADVVKLLLEGSKADPSPSLSLEDGGQAKEEGGDKDAKHEIVKAEEHGKGLSTLLLSGIRKKDASLNGIFGGPGGLPPFPTGMNSSSSSSRGEKQYVLDTERAEGFPEGYPCRTFV